MGTKGKEVLLEFIYEKIDCKLLEKLDWTGNNCAHWAVCVCVYICVCVCVLVYIYIYIYGRYVWEGREGFVMSFRVEMVFILVFFLTQAKGSKIGTLRYIASVLPLLLGVDFVYFLFFYVIHSVLTVCVCVCVWY
jgi:hypothetical protein